MGIGVGLMLIFYSGYPTTPSARVSFRHHAFFFLFLPRGVIGNINCKKMTTIPTKKPNDYLVLSILTTILCCLPLGIVSIIRSTQVNSYWANEKFDEAQNASMDAKKWSIIGICISAAGILLYLIVVIIFAAIGISAAEL